MQSARHIIKAALTAMPMAAGEAFSTHQQLNLFTHNKHSYYSIGMSDDLGFLLGDAARLLRRSFDVSVVRTFGTDGCVN